MNKYLYVKGVNNKFLHIYDLLDLNLDSKDIDNFIQCNYSDSEVEYDLVESYRIQVLKQDDFDFGETDEKPDDPVVEVICNLFDRADQFISNIDDPRFNKTKEELLSISDSVCNRLVTMLSSSKDT